SARGARNAQTSQCRRAERRQDREAPGRSSQRLPAGNWPDTGPGRPGPKGRPRGAGERVKGHGVATREPKDKLDASAAAGANGPEGDALAWLSIDWQRVEG